MFIVGTHDIVKLYSVGSKKLYVPFRFFCGVILSDNTCSISDIMWTWGDGISIYPVINTWLFSR